MSTGKDPLYTRMSQAEALLEAHLEARTWGYKNSI